MLNIAPQPKQLVKTKTIKRLFLSLGAGSVKEDAPAENDLRQEARYPDFGRQFAPAGLK
jgi:hypothetical protein